MSTAEEVHRSVQKLLVGSPWRTPKPARDLCWPARPAILLVAILLLAGASASAVPADDEVAEIVARQRQSAILQSLLIPFFSLEGRDETELFCVSVITDPILIDLFAISPAGEQVYLGRETLLPSRNLSLDLRSALASAGGAFLSGNLRLDFVAPPGPLQAWAVVRSGRQSFEVPWLNKKKVAGNELLSYWDAAAVGPRPKVRVEYHVTNTTDQPVNYTLAQSRGPRVVREETGTLGPWQSRVHVVGGAGSPQPGWLRLTHDGPSGALIGAGVIAAGERLAYLPVVPPEALAKGPRFEVLRVPGGAGAPARTSLTLFNSADAAQRVTIDGLVQATGALIGSKQISLAPKEVATIGVEKLFGRNAAEGVRLRVKAPSPSLSVDGAVVTPKGEVLALSVHPASTAHKSGTYPIPDLDRFAVRTTIVNLGAEEAEIFGQYFWDGGTYSVAPQVVPAGGTLVIDPDEITARGKADALHRTFDPEGKHLMFKWMVHRGSKQLLGRTEVRPRGRADGFGFNCGGCCWQVPVASIEPESVEFFPGESPQFEALVGFSTCSGEIGPWSADPVSSDVPWPFGWNFFNVSATGGGDEPIVFDVVETKIGDSCNEQVVVKRGSGRADTCKEEKHGYDENQICSVQTNSCTQCRTCCTYIYNWKICKKINRDFAQAEKNACDGACAIDHGDTCPP